MEVGQAVVLPLKNGTIFRTEQTNGWKIASFRGAGRSEEYVRELALPLVIVAGEMGFTGSGR